MKHIITSTLLITAYTSLCMALTPNIDFKSIIQSTQLESLRKILFSQKEITLLKQQCRIEINFLYPPVSCLKLINQLRIYHQKPHFLDKKKKFYDQLCLRRTQHMKSVKWIQKALEQKVGQLCEKSLIHQKQILDYRASNKHFQRK